MFSAEGKLGLSTDSAVAAKGSFGLSLDDEMGSLEQ